jgi:AraC-like DNA-binding protein/mannose-6-phosphate isomerase-like protein (cupin superfamily)
VETAIYDTATLPLMRRGAFWLDDVCARHIGVHGRTHVYNDPFFYGRMQRTAGAEFVSTALTCSGGMAQRQPVHMRRWTHDRAVVFVQRGRGAIWRQRGRELNIGPGDLVVANPDEPYELITLGDFNITSFYVPRTLLTGHQHPGDIDMPRAVSQSDAAGALASGFATALSDRIGDLSEQQAANMVDTLARLVAVAAGAAAPEHGQALRCARLNQALTYIARNLADPALTPASCAQALGMSVRALHLAFEPSGESFSQAVARLRLERCRALLLDRAAAARPVSDIAYACGFGSLAGFYRAFSRAFGASPTEFRSAGT